MSCVTTCVLDDVCAWFVGVVVLVGHVIVRLIDCLFRLEVYQALQMTSTELYQFIPVLMTLTLF